VTTLIAFIAVDQRGPSSLYFASDSRITWEPEKKPPDHIAGKVRWDSGRKLFACKQHADIFGYAGDVLFPSLVIGQMTDAADMGLLFSADDHSETRHRKFMDAIRSSIGRRYNAPDFDFHILRGSRDSSGMKSMFRVWYSYYSTKTKSWYERGIPIPTDKSTLLIAVGTGEESAIEHDALVSLTPQQGTSRAAFWGFCDSLRSNRDPLSGGPPQLVSLYRQENAKTLGVVYNGERFFQGLPLPDGILFNQVEWRDENFQRIDGNTLQLLEGAQRQVREDR